jgi:hypothetical protein
MRARTRPVRWNMSLKLLRRVITLFAVTDQNQTSVLRLVPTSGPFIEQTQLKSTYAMAQIVADLTPHMPASASKEHTQAVP